MAAVHQARTTSTAPCASEDCGPYAAMLHWTPLDMASPTGYDMYLNDLTAGHQVADVLWAPTCFTGCTARRRSRSGCGLMTGPWHRPPLLSVVHDAAVPDDVAVPAFGERERPIHKDRERQALADGRDSPWGVIGNLSVSEAKRYFPDRVAHGFNTAMFALLCDHYAACNANGTTYDGIAPFTSGSGPDSYDLTTPNARYFQRAHDIISEANDDGARSAPSPDRNGRRRRHL